MSQALRLSWDFFGPQSSRTAEHFKSHLQEFLAKHALSYAPELEEHAGATSVHLQIAELDSEPLRRALRPRRIEHLSKAKDS